MKGYKITYKQIQLLSELTGKPEKEFVSITKLEASNKIRSLLSRDSTETPKGNCDKKHYNW